MSSSYVALAPIFDSETGQTHMAGHHFEMDSERGSKLVVAGLARTDDNYPIAQFAPSPEPEPEPEDATDLTSLYKGMTRAELFEILESRGVSVSKRASKAELLSKVVESDG